LKNDKGIYSFSLENNSEVEENDHKVALVECVNIVSEDGNVEQEPICRWFEVPEKWA